MDQPDPVPVPAETPSEPLTLAEAANDLAFRFEALTMRAPFATMGLCLLAGIGVGLLVTRRR
ncbi:hypothetical protein [Asticcacaulis solisilvae]|uniref:hypothetical protein n=1 Tax=Asticcacaulis solisilvae TaxID=1217274 RepID=UPI003FD8929E